MTRTKFLQELRRALSGRLPESAVQENVGFYDGYIKEEVRNGRDEEEVLRMLGDPLLIARTILDTPKREPKRSSGRAEKGFSSLRRGLGGFERAPWKKIAVIALCILLSIAVSIIVRGLLRFILPVAIPVLAVFAIVKIIRKK